MTSTLVVLFLLGLFTKHLLVDFPLQGPYHYLNKGTYGHPGGIEHAWWHAVGTFCVSTWFVGLELACTLAAIDMVIHYHIDWAKMNLNKKLKWGPTTHEEFWWLLGTDQYLHVLTYLGFAYYVA